MNSAFTKWVIHTSQGNPELAALTLQRALMLNPSPENPVWSLIEEFAGDPMDSDNIARAAAWLIDEAA